MQKDRRWQPSAGDFGDETSGRVAAECAQPHTSARAGLVSTKLAYLRHEILCRATQPHVADVYARVELSRHSLSMSRLL